jgi:mannose-6-phosphate isomerase-like protein (cupin superfamily)
MPPRPTASADGCPRARHAPGRFVAAPRGTDPQQPHTRDEAWRVARGAGWFVNGDHRHPIATHDVLFVKAGAVHRFEGFGDDFLVWVFFYGPEGGETDSAG